MKVGYLFLFMIVACRPSNQIGELVEATNARPLEDTTWLLIELKGKETSTVDYRTPIFVRYQKEGNKVNGFAGCNTFTGSYKNEGSTISATLASTRMFCEGKMEVETEFMNVLNTPNKHKMEGSHLIFRNEGKVVARFLPEVKTTN